jgi:hypothetical protein
MKRIWFSSYSCEHLTKWFNFTTYFRYGRLFGLVPNGTLLDGWSKPCSLVDFKRCNVCQLDVQLASVITEGVVCFGSFLSQRLVCSFVHLSVNIETSSPLNNIWEYRSFQVLDKEGFRSLWWCIRISGWGLLRCSRQRWVWRLEARPLKVDMRREELWWSTSEHSRNQGIDSKRSLRLLLRTMGFFYTN